MQPARTARPNRATPDRQPRRASRSALSTRSAPVVRGTRCAFHAQRQSLAPPEDGFVHSGVSDTTPAPKHPPTPRQIIRNP
jgi:hypothetical protein